MSRSLLLGCALAPLLLASAAQAQDEDQPLSTAPPETTTVQELIVTGQITFRDRTADVNPVLSYPLEYFQRFEPVSVGEMLKRVPGVTFTADVLEFDGVSMRGLPPGYTQILINGRRAPGGETDRSFFVDRIPAEMVERIEVVRSPRADEPSEGVGGTLNIVLKDGATLEGGFVKGGALINADGEVRPSAAIAYADTIGDTSYWAALNYQGRRNPKQKESFRFDGDFGAPVDSELQEDTRDGVDISGNAEVTHRWDGGRVRFNGLFVDTNRDEDETSRTFGDDGEDLDELTGVEIQRERISQQTYSFSADAQFEAGPGEVQLNAGWSGYRENTDAEVDAGDNFEELELDEHTELDITDDEWRAGAAYVWRNGPLRVKAGVDYLDKHRDGAEIEFEIEDGEVGDPDPAPGAIFDISERRIDPYVRVTLETESKLFTVDAGLRLETTDREVTSDLGTVSHDDQSWNPSLHLTWRPTGNDQFRASIAHTVRRPEYEFLAPFIAFEEPADDKALAGNPLLENEKAWGLDVGYERRLGPRGVIGVNFFYRDINDLIELVDTGEEILEDEDDPDSLFDLVEPRNIGSGSTWGIEIDFSTPLDFIGLPDTGFFLNYTWMDSEVTDPFTGEERRFANQPHNVYNIGFIHTVPAWDVSFGASYYDRDEGVAVGLDEIATVDYEGNLEAFVEKRFGKRWVVRFAATNILDMKKTETFRAFDGDTLEEILDNRRLGNVAESERESERSGQLYQVTVRAAF